MLDPVTPRAHEPAYRRPDALWPLTPWLSWGYHGLFVPGHTAYQFFRFCLIGSIGVLVNMAIMYLAYDLFALQYMLASVLAFSVASINNFILNKIFTFHDKERRLQSVIKQYLKFLSVALIGMGLNLGVLVALVEMAGVYPVYANLAGVFAATLSNFVGNKFFAFKAGA
jgi:putative flippase GtrA